MLQDGGSFLVDNDVDTKEEVDRERRMVLFIR
jgi:hypothetical protein